MDLLLIGGGILLLYWLGTSAGAQTPGTTGPAGTGLVSPTSALAATSGGVLQDIGRVVGQVSTVASIGKAAISAPTQISKAVSALVGPGAPSPPTSEFSLFTQGPPLQEILPADLVDAMEFIPSAEQAISAGSEVAGAVEFIPSAEQAISAGAELLVPEAVESLVPIAGEEAGALSISQVVGDVPLLSATGEVLSEAPSFLSEVFSTLSAFALPISIGVGIVAGTVTSAIAMSKDKAEIWLKEGFAKNLNTIRAHGGWAGALRDLDLLRQAVSDASARDAAVIASGSYLYTGIIQPPSVTGPATLADQLWPQASGWYWSTQDLVSGYSILRGALNDIAWAYLQHFQPGGPGDAYVPIEYFQGLEADIQRYALNPAPELGDVPMWDPIVMQPTFEGR
jgi:hypothetical protein